MPCLPSSTPHFFLRCKIIIEITTTATTTTIMVIIMIIIIMLMIEERRRSTTTTTTMMIIMELIYDKIHNEQLFDCIIYKRQYYLPLCLSYVTCKKIFHQYKIWSVFRSLLHRFSSTCKIPAEEIHSSCSDPGLSCLPRLSNMCRS